MVNSLKTDEADNQRLKCFKSSLNELLVKYENIWKPSTVKSYFKDLPVNDANTIRTSIVNAVMAKIVKNLDKVIEEDIDKEPLDTLNTLCENIQGDEDCWRPSGCPTKDIKAHYYELLKKEKMNLEKNLEDIKESNENIVLKIKEKREEYLNKNEKLEQFCEKN